TFRYWEEDPGRSEPPVWCPAGWDVDRNESEWGGPLSESRVAELKHLINESFRFRFHPWEPRNENRAAYEERVRSAFEALLGERLNQIEGILRRRRRPIGRPKIDDDHYRWLVQYQVGETSF